MGCEDIKVEVEGLPEEEETFNEHEIIPENEDKI